MNMQMRQGDKGTRGQGEGHSSFSLSPCLLVPLSLLLVSCGGSPKSTGPALDAELAQSLSAARSAFNQGAYAQAATLYQRALRRAEVMDDAVHIANTAYDYAAASMQTGKLDDA